MKYFWLLLLAFAPLLGLTTYSLVDALVLRKDEPPPVVSIPPASAAEPRAEEAAERALEYAAAERSLVDRWAATDLAEMRPAPVPTPASDSLLSPVAQAWQRSRRGREFLAHCRTHLGGAVDSDQLEAARQERTRLAKFFAQVGTEYNDLPGVETLIRDLRQRDDLLARRIAAEARRQEVEQALASAERLLLSDEADPKRAQLCLDQLDRPPLGDPQKLKADGLDYAERLAAARVRAECRLRWAEIPRAAPEKAQPAELLTVSSFLDRYADGPAASYLTAVERRFLDLALARKRRLEMLAKVAAIESADELSELLVLAAKVVDDPDIAAGDKRKAREAVLSRLREHGLPKLDAPELLRGEKREVITVAGERIIGLFQKVGEVKYRYWHTEQERQDETKALGKGDVLISKIEEGPITPHYVQWADGLNLRREELLARPGERALWDKLSASLAQWEKELRAYQNRWQQQAHPADRLCSAWSFRQHRETVDEVLAHWQEFSRVMGRSPARSSVGSSSR